jgi:DNA transformation protein
MMFRAAFLVSSCFARYTLPMGTTNHDFATYCCDLLAAVGPCLARRMFGGYGISTDGLTLAIVADLGGGETLWLKADPASRAQFEAAGCTQFVYLVKGKPQGMNYYSAPADAMESPALMAPWARLSLDCAVRARAAKSAKPIKTIKSAKPPRGR